MQLRTIKIGLLAYLTYINSEIVRYRRDLGNHTPEYILIECLLLHELRGEMRILAIEITSHYARYCTNTYF